MLDDDPAFLRQQLEQRFPRAELLDGKQDFKALIAQVVAFVSDPSRGLNLPLDIRGTVFQQQVWQALRKIPAGSTVTYTDIAKRIGHPESVRAVANAVGANPVAVAIPCHRVIHKDGTISGYRWGVDRKRKLIDRERKTK
jgi:AraC family transcriptional regulator, regulatory protein of adaptative response / methylated-DNA-[protein]-cysteine methyltransferase